MAAKVTAKSGHHVNYYRQLAAPGGERSPLSYYSAGTRQGEAPGRWFGKALPALGLTAGEVVDMEDDGPYTQVYEQVNPLTGERLGRAPRTADGMRESILAELEAAEPHATRERHWQLAREAGDGERAAYWVAQDRRLEDILQELTWRDCGTPRSGRE